MIKLSRLFFVSTALSLFVIQSSSSISYSQSSSSNFDRKSGVTKPEKSTESIAPATAPEKNPGVITDPLVRVLISKGVLNDEEGRSISISGTPSEQRNRLAVLLRDKGLLSAAEYEAVRTVAPTEDMTKTVAYAVESAAPSTAATESTTPATPQAPAQIAAVAPVRLLGIESPKREGLIPDIKLGTGARIKVYVSSKPASFTIHRHRRATISRCRYSLETLVQIRSRVALKGAVDSRATRLIRRCRVEQL